MPVLDDLNAPNAQYRLGLDAAGLPTLNFTAMRLLEYAEANCLNLNRVARPSLLGVSPAAFVERNAFTFAKTMSDNWTGSPWRLLELDLGPDTVPGIADETVITWGLGKALGDVVQYVDEHGRSFNVKLVGSLTNSIFQGRILIPERAFGQRFPSVAGKRVHLWKSRLRRMPSPRCLTSVWKTTAPILKQLKRV